MKPLRVLVVSLNSEIGASVLQLLTENSRSDQVKFAVAFSAYCGDMSQINSLGLYAFEADWCSVTQSSAHSVQRIFSELKKFGSWLDEHKVDLVIFTGGSFLEQFFYSAYVYFRGNSSLCSCFDSVTTMNVERKFPWQALPVGMRKVMARAGA